MKTLIALLLSAAPVVAQDSPWVFDDPFVWSISEQGGGDRSTGGTDVTSSSAVQVSETPALESFVHRINVVNRGGSATCIAPGVFVTCKHLFDGLRGYQVSIDGTAVEASVTLAPAHDVAIVIQRAGASTAPTVKFDRESPAYLSECVAFGFGSETLHRGFISNDDTLSLTSDGGIEQGDSGGAVFCNGTLVGVIRGKNPANPRVCYFTPLESVAALVAPFTPDSSRNAGEPAADDKRTVSIISPKTWGNRPYIGRQRDASGRVTYVGDCPYCEDMKEADYSNQPYVPEFIQADGHESYPHIEWQGANGRRQILSGYYTPWQVGWSWKATQ